MRPATADDVPAVAALDAHVFGAEAWSEPQIREELTGERRKAWVIGTPVVAYAVTLETGDTVDLQRIAVHPDHQRLGLARRLLDVAVSAARTAQADRVLLEVGAGNTAALAFYAAAGFSEIDRRRRYYRDGSDAVVMLLPLAAPSGGGRG